MVYLVPADLARIERELQLTLPAHYKEFHLQQQPLIKQLRACWPADEAFMMLATDVKWLLEMNKLMGFPRTEGPCRGKFCIGDDGCGDYRFISLENPADTTVYMVDHDGYSLEEIFDEEANDYIWSHEGLHSGNNLEDFVREVIADYAEPNES